MDENIPFPYQSLCFETDTDLVEQLLTETLADPTHLYRGPTSEVQAGDIKFDLDNRPIIESNIPALAYRDGGWDGVVKTLRDTLASTGNNDLSELIVLADRGEIQSPFIWTSPNINVGSAFSHGIEGLHNVLMVMKPSPERVSIEENTRGDFRNYIAAVKARKPYMIKLGFGDPAFEEEVNQLIQDTLPPDYGNFDEIVMGPYIDRSEIKALISYQEGSRFQSLVGSINRKLKN